ncbi:Exportin-2 [Cardamine amara subsp. amara]|uniref:Exportin-2 n=1 Tax=Cardamine amara subsp. amara TaxID=228776 RepID=A0ABD0ZP58_CARAN
MPDVGYTAAFVKLHSIGKKEEDPLSDIRDPKELLASSVARLFSADPAKYTQIIGENLEQANQEALLQLCNAYNCKIV